MSRIAEEMNSLNRIIFITNLNVLGGTENNLVSVVTHPVFNSTFISSVFSGTPPHPAIAARLAEFNVRIVQHNRLAKIRMPRTFRGHLFDRQLNKVDPDVVVFWNHVARPGQLTVCRRSSIRTVFFERGTGWKEHDPERMNNFLSSMDLVLSNSRAGAKILQLKWGYEGDCVVLPNALRPEIADRHVSDRVSPRLDSPMRIGVAARLVAYKGVASVVLAAKRLAESGLNAELHIAGDGPEGRMLQELCKKNALPANFLGAVQDMAGFYDGIDLLVCPSIREPFGTVVLEAQARGCPVVCAGVDGLPEIVLHGKTGFIVEPRWELEEYLEYVSSREDMPEVVYCPGRGSLDSPLASHPGDVAAAVRQTVSDPDGYLNMSRAAREFVLKNFRFDSHLKSFRDILLQAQ